MTIRELPLGTLVGNRYLIQQVLGQGGFGRTYKAYDHHRFDKPCVLKEFIPRANNPQVLQKSQELFEREAKILFQLKHPQIPEFYGIFRENGRLFIVQEYVDGKNYWTLLRERQNFLEAEVIQLLCAILPILDYIHERNIFHRDISPDNIMQPNNLSHPPVLIDFGVVKQIYVDGIDDPSLSGGYTCVGKRDYAPPEQFLLGQCFPSSDLYALANTAIVLLTGKIPNALEWESYPGLSKGLAQVLKKMLQDKPPERYQSAKEVMVALNSLPTILEPEEKTKRPSDGFNPRLSNAWRYFLGLLTVLLVMGIGIRILSPHVPMICSILNDCVKKEKPLPTPSPSPTTIETTPPKLPCQRLFGECP